MRSNRRLWEFDNYALQKANRTAKFALYPDCKSLHHRRIRVADYAPGGDWRSGWQPGQGDCVGALLARVTILHRTPRQSSQQVEKLGHSGKSCVRLAFYLKG